ncbi:aromatic compound dioxygenase, partial [Armillaria gallica]
EKSAARHTTLVDELRKKRGLVTRKLPLSSLATKRMLNDIPRCSVQGTITSNNVSTTTRLSSEANLTMELDQEMSYVRGEYVRLTISEDQSGVYTYVDLELIDVSTCKTAPDLYIDFWHCNSTGVYSGDLGPGNGAIQAIFPTWSDKTFLRGIQPTNGEGNAPFETIFPGISFTGCLTEPCASGHYSGRATHFNTDIRSQGIVFGRHFYRPSIHYIGQIFFDQDLISSVEAISLYNTNIIKITTNSVDQVFVLGFGSTILNTSTLVMTSRMVCCSGVSSVST